MKRNVSLGVGLFAWLAVLSGCAALGGSAACGRGAPSVEPERARPGEAFVFRGVGFGGGCDDSNMPFRPEPPQQDVRIEMRQGGRTWDLATADAGGPPDYGIETTLEVPQDAESGGALVVTDAGPDDPFGPLEVPFEVPFEVRGASEADRGTVDPGASNGGREEPVASGVAAACAGGGTPVDLIAEGTVERVRVGPDSSLTKIRVERVLQGDAGETVRVRTGSGTEGPGYVPRFEQGERYRLFLQREGGGRGDVYTTNICLGTERLE